MCPTCGKSYGKRKRCYSCQPGGSPRAGEDRVCKECRKGFYVPRWKINETRYRAGLYCSKACLHESLRLNGEDNSRWARRIFTAYGLSVAEFQAMEARQNGLCAICSGLPNGPGTRLHVDHCHETNKVRGLLCAKCNTAIGLLNEDAALFAAATHYLRTK